MKLAQAIIGNYKLNLLISATVALAVLAFRVDRNILNILLTVFGALVGTFVLDLDYILEAFWSEPTSEFSQNLRSLFAQKNYAAAVSYIALHKSELPKRVLNSTAFQAILGAVAFFMATSSNSRFGLAVTICTFAQSFYQMYLDYDRTKSISHWFWILKNPPSRAAQVTYVLAMGALLIYILFSIR